MAHKLKLWIVAKVEVVIGTNSNSSSKIVVIVYEWVTHLNLELKTEETCLGGDSTLE